MSYRRAADYIRQLETLGHVNASEAFHIAFGVDENFVPPLGIMLTSLLINNPDCAFHVHVFCNSIRDEDLIKLRKFVNQNADIRLDLYLIDASVFNGFHLDKLDRGYTAATYNRILIAQVLYPAVERLLYLDADTICVGRLKELETFSFDGNILAAVPDRGDWLLEHKPDIGFAPDEVYFNSGVLYIDLKKWNEFGMSDKMSTLLREGVFAMQDQDAINLIARNLIKPLPVRFNQFLLLKEAPRPIPDDTIIIHFAGQLKPWQPWCKHPQREIYDAYRNQSLWKDFVYHPRHYQENRLMGRAMRQRGDWSSALKFYCRYVFCKFFKRNG